jgi:hypothetical protein
MVSQYCCENESMFVSACSGGHPAEWIVTDVSQLGEGDRLPTHMKLTMGRLTYYIVGILACT